MKKLRDFLYARNLYLWVSGALSFLVFLVLSGLCAHMGSGQLSQQMAQRWSEHKDMSQVSCFFSANAGIDTDRIEMFRHTLEGALQEASIVSDAPNANARLWADAYSAEGKITVSSDRATLSADAIGTGGDFFLFHPLQLLDGSYYSESDLNQDHCILDEEAAWQLFGSNDIAGMTVTIDGIPHIVTGIVHRDEGRLEEAAGLDSTVIYVSYSTLEAHGTTYGINHYEIVMPNPVEGYALNYITENIGAEEKEVEIVENTGRYDWLKRFQIMGDFATRSMNSKAIIYPYWENVARGYEDLIALISLVAALFLLYPTVLFAVFIILCWKRRSWTVGSIWRSLKKRLEYGLERSCARRARKKKYKDRFDDEEELL